jgi:hypothetical protein
MGYEPVTIREAVQLEVLLFVGLAFVVALLIIYWGFQTYQFGRLIRDTPPESVQSVAMGRTEIQGQTVPSDRMYDQPFTEGQCVYCEYEVKEYKESGDDDGKSWQTIDSGSYGTSFLVDDGTGQILVDPNEDTVYEISDEYDTEMRVGNGEKPPETIQKFLGGPDVELTDESDDEGRIRSFVGGLKGRIFGDDSDDDQPVEDPTEQGPTTGDEPNATTGNGPNATTGNGSDATTGEKERADSRADGGDPSATDDRSYEYIRRGEIASVSDTNNQRRYIQKVIPVDEKIYVYGGAQRRDLEDTVGVDITEVIRTDPSTGEFIISDKGEYSLASDYTKRSILYMGSGIVSGVLVLALLAQILITGSVYGIEAALP